MNKQTHFEEAETWVTKLAVREQRYHRMLVSVTIVAVGVAALQAVAIALMLPLKQTVPVTVLVDRQTGHVEEVDPRSPRRISGDRALTQSFLAQYVAARETFDRATIRSEYRKVGLWSAGVARSRYLSDTQASNPLSPWHRLPAGTSVRATVRSVTFLGPNLASVRFDVRQENQFGGQSRPTPYVATVRFDYVDAPMAIDDRYLNPLGFQVTDYRKSMEVPEMSTNADELSTSSPLPGAATYPPSGATRP